MHVGFLVNRQTYYRHFGPLVDAALSRGWDVTCWHFQGESKKHYQKPTKEILDACTYGQPEIINYFDFKEIDDLAKKADAVISLHGKALYNVSCHTPWISIQHNIDSFTEGAASLLSADTNCIFTNFWIEWAGRFYEKCGIMPSREFMRSFMPKAVTCGIVEMDVMSKIDPEEVKKRWGIPAGKPVVVYLNNPYSFIKLTSWYRWIHSETIRAKQLINMAVHPSMLKYYKEVLNGWNNKAVIKAVRLFCDANNACLLLKAREKFPPMDYERQLADICLFDQNSYPPTFQEITAIADFVISTYSTTVMQSVYNGVPYLLMDMLGGIDEHTWPWYFAMEECEPPTLFRCPGAVWRMNLGQIIEELPLLRLDDFVVQQEAREQYVNKLLGPDDGKASCRVLDVVERCAKKKK